MKILSVVTAVLMSCAFVSSAQAENKIVVLTDEQMSTLSAGVASAKTPEEAARLFAKLASVAIGQAVADVLAQAVGATTVQTQANAAIQGWEALLGESDLGLEFHWASPGLSPMGALPNTHVVSGGAAGGVAPAITWGVSIGGNF